MRVRVIAVGTRMPAWVRERLRGLPHAPAARTLNVSLAARSRPARAAPARRPRGPSRAEGERLLAALRPASTSSRSMSAARSSRTRELAAWLRRAHAGGRGSGLPDRRPRRARARGARARNCTLVAVAPDAAACPGARAARRAALPRHEHPRQPSRIIATDARRHTPRRCSAWPRHRRGGASCWSRSACATPRARRRHRRAVRAGERAADYVVRMARAKARAVRAHGGGAAGAGGRHHRGARRAHSRQAGRARPRASPCSSASRAARTRC